MIQAVRIHSAIAALSFPYWRLSRDVLLRKCVNYSSAAIAECMRTVGLAVCIINCLRRKIA